MNNYIISIDWFQVSCMREAAAPLFQGMQFSGILYNDEGKQHIYHIEQGHEYNAMFDLCFEVRKNNFPVATIYAAPRPSTLPEGLCMIKMRNYLLYTPRWLWYLYDIMRGLSWTFHNITRVDLAIDFNFFLADLSPREFIRRYLASGPSTDEEPHYWRIGSNKFNTIGNRRVVDDERHVITDCDYLRWGSRSSGVCTYLYNKTAELNDKGGKQYIRDIWAQGGLQDTEETPVYRIEFSISPQAMNVKRPLTEDERIQQAEAQNIVDKTLRSWQIRALAMDDFSSQAKVQNVFWTYYQHYFRFRKIGPQKMPHNWPEVFFFSPELNLQMKPYLVHQSRDSGVAEANAAKRIARLIDTTNIPIEDKLSMKRTAEILSRYADIREGYASPESIAQMAVQLTEGADFDTIVRSGRIPKSHIALLKSYIEGCIKRDLQAYLDIPQVVDIITEEDCSRELARENIEALSAYEQEMGIQPCISALDEYLAEIERRNKIIRDKYERNLSL